MDTWVYPCDIITSYAAYTERRREMTSKLLTKAVALTLTLVLIFLLESLLGLSTPQPILIRASQAAFGWHVETVDSTGDVGEYTSLALDSAGHPHISYYDHTDTDLKYARWTGSSWAIETVDSAGTVGGFTSLALDSAGHPHISYLDGTNDDLKYARWTGSSWTIKTVDSAGTVPFGFTSLALDTAGNPHISYYDHTNTALKYARWTGSGWDIQTVDSEGDVGVYTSLALDAAGNPHISYYDETNTALKYARWTGSGWDIQTVADTYQSGLYNSLALDAAGNPHISYFLHYWPGAMPEPYTALKYARWTGSEWDIQTVEGAWGVDVGSYPSLALDTADNPHISYYGWYGFNKGDLKYARWTGSAWDIQTVDSSGGLGSIGWYTSLALDAPGNPHISYYAWTNGDLKYAYISTYRVYLPVVFRNY